jgi:hypothetical protein
MSPIRVILSFNKMQNVRNKIGPLLIEGVFIVVSVLLGFGVAQYGGNRADRQLAKRALTGLRAEIEYNLALVEPYIAFHRAHIKELQPYVTPRGRRDITGESAGVPDDASGFEVFLKLRPPLPPKAETDTPLVRRAAWDAAVSSGALRLIDYDLVASLSEIYQMQDHLSEAAHRTPMTSAAFFDRRERIATIRQAQTALSEVAWTEQSLVNLYRQQLPALRSAAAR